MEPVAGRVDRFVYNAAVFHNRLAAAFAHEQHLHNARFANPHKLQDIVSPTLGEMSLLLAEGPYNHILRVGPKTRKELGNVLAVAPPRGGKGLFGIAQILDWPYNLIINDIKGEHFLYTAGWRSKYGKVFVIDPTGVGNKYDPLQGRETEDDLYDSAKHLLYEPNERDPVFTQRATKMLQQLFIAAKEEERRAKKDGRKALAPLPYVGQLIQFGPKYAAARLYMISPLLAARFLDNRMEDADWGDKFLQSAWGTLTAKLWTLITETTIRCFSGSDFQASDLLLSEKPITIYLRWPERNLLALTPLVKLVWHSIVEELLHTYDKRNGKDCKPVLLLIDEAGRCPVPQLQDYSSTVNGRGMSIWAAYQSLSQIEAHYGKYNAETIINNMDSQIYYRQASQNTAEYIRRSLDETYDFSHSRSTHGKSGASEGVTEHITPLMTAREIRQMDDTDIIGFHRNLLPFRAKRMDWRRFPHLVRRQQIPPPSLSPLPKVSDFDALPGLQSHFRDVPKPAAAQGRYSRYPRYPYVPLY